ncbi:Predicted kinase, aminoglycoside phosphotransferase (APT) family [Micromonospora pattaloongensis]|uniref:Predicted kinase, aminoglycoside phosphotransferase (APT) family n=1 Tax=Micromonospora pattaloongensis TaxID=405436 RepID=A0A1H3SQI1_9ACTN|nr:aminoglycoside phosphotransferase family protein [Micromonospora pattaloongensis]SDZ39835.1 Predicted kinase, aminoglycoside phosphotransferase (APT) family [Micromonospora pattaloongensis]
MMHDNEYVVDARLVRRLVARQFPQWADLPLRAVESTGTNNAIYRLGDDMVVRLPRIAAAVEQVRFEYEWLPRLAAVVPAAIPEPIALGTPDEAYPCPWAINRWVEGVHPTENDGGDQRFAQSLGEFIAVLRDFDATGARQGYRTGPLHTRDTYVREWVAKAEGLIDAKAVLAVWQDALDLPQWSGPPRWTHGDLLPGNVLVQDGRLTAVIDFGAAGVGDPACDALPAWTLLTAETRPTFRAAAGFDDATWARGRAWALTFVGGITYYRRTNPAMADLGRRAIAEVLQDLASEVG